MKPFYGLDFGTSNLSIAIQNGEGTQVLPIDGQNKTMPTGLYFGPSGGEPIVGQSAMLRYVADGMSGRFMQSLKSVLPNSGFTGTYLDRLGFADIEDLIAYILRDVRQRANEQVGMDIDRAVFGRPAEFSKDPEEETMAIERLMKAAKLAGFNEVELQLEPIAAAFHYEMSLDREEVVLVADLGGGTTDFTVTRLSPKRRRKRDRSKDILSTGGVYIGGDKFDSAVMEMKLLKYFGQDAEYNSWEKWMRFPSYLVRGIMQWQEIAFLKDTRTMRVLNDLVRYARTKEDKECAIRLLTLIDENLGFSLFQTIETAKRGLSTYDSDCIYFNQSAIKIVEPIFRNEFDEIIAFALEEYEQCVDQVLADAGVSNGRIDSVFLTGGSSLVPCVQSAFANRFGEDKLRRGDTFISVASGLASSQLLS